jgi:hypothetical protein
METGTRGDRTYTYAMRAAKDGTVYLAIGEVSQRQRLRWSAPALFLARFQGWLLRRMKHAGRSLATR